jgi:hypothetical protein
MADRFHSGFWAAPGTPWDLAPILALILALRLIRLGTRCNLRRFGLDFRGWPTPGKRWADCRLKKSGSGSAGFGA